MAFRASQYIRRFGLALLLTAGCSGGYYNLSEALPATPSADGTAVPPATGYVTATVRLVNAELLLTDSFRTSRNSDLSHLYIYADFQQSPSGPRTIPLYLVDLDHGTYRGTDADELLSRLPYNANSVGTQLFEIKTVALDKNFADTVAEVWEMTDELVKDLGGMTGGPNAMAAFKIIDTATKTLKKFGSREKILAKKFMVPNRPTQSSFAEVLLVTPTDSSAQPIESAAHEKARFVAATDAKKVAVAKQGRLSYLTVDGKRFTNLPYILIEYQLDEYVYDRRLLTQVTRGCPEITRSQLESARNALYEATAISPRQARLETEVLTRAEFVLTVLEAQKTNSHASIINQHYQARLLPPLSRDVLKSTLYTNHFRENVATLEGCLGAAVAAVPGSTQVEEILAELDARVDMDQGTQEHLEAALQRVNARLGSLEGNDLAYLRDTRPGSDLASRREQLRTRIWDRFFASRVRRLATLEVSDEASNAAADLINDSVTTQCEPCRTKAADAVVAYRTRSQQELEAAKATMLRRAASVLAEARASSPDGVLSEDLAMLARKIDELKSLAPAKTATYKQLFDDLSALTGRLASLG